MRRPRPELDDVLAVRVHRMLANGFVEEVRALLPLGHERGEPPERHWVTRNWYAISTVS